MKAYVLRLINPCIQIQLLHNLRVNLRPIVHLLRHLLKVKFEADNRRFKFLSGNIVLVCQALLLQIMLFFDGVEDIELLLHLIHFLKCLLVLCRQIPIVSVNCCHFLVGRLQIQLLDIDGFAL